MKKVADSIARREFREILERSSIGQAVIESVYICTGPLGHHMASDVAIDSGVMITRCIACHRRILFTEAGWKEMRDGPKP